MRAGRVAGLGYGEVYCELGAGRSGGRVLPCVRVYAWAGGDGQVGGWVSRHGAGWMSEWVGVDGGGMGGWAWGWLGMGMGMGPRGFVAG